MFLIGRRYLCHREPVGLTRTRTSLCNLIKPFSFPFFLCTNHFLFLFLLLLVLFKVSPLSWDPLFIITNMHVSVSQTSWHFTSLHVNCITFLSHRGKYLISLLLTFVLHQFCHVSFFNACSSSIIYAKV